MSKKAAASAASEDQALPLPEVQLEFHHGALRPTVYQLSDVSFLIGSVPGCDVRIPGTNLPPLLCTILRRPGGVSLRKLSPTFPMLLNGESAGNGPVQDGDRLTIGKVELVFHVQMPAAGEGAAPVRNGKSTPEHAAAAR